MSASCWDPARVLLTVHHEGSYCEHSWARMAKILFVGVCVKVVLCDMKSMRLEHELLRLPDSDPQLCTTFQALKVRAQTKTLVVKHKHKRTPPPITPRALKGFNGEHLTYKAHVGAPTEGGPNRANPPTQGILKFA